MTRSGIERYAPLSGVIFVAVLIICFIVSGSTPSATDSTAKVVSYYNDHGGKEMAAAAIGALAVVFLVFWGGVVRSAILRAEGGVGRIGATAFGGFIIIGVAGGLFSAMQFAAADVGDNATGSAPSVSPAAVQALSILSNDLFFPLVIGTVVAMAAAAIATFRLGVFPKALGWFSVLIVIVSVTPIGFFGFMGFMLWSLIASILLFRAQPAAAAPPAATPPPPVTTTP